ncbi:MAG: response regulator [Polyangiaceae bacterium]|nr:response regulator [Polyangiaceae bacterium]
MNFSQLDRATPDALRDVPPAPGGSGRRVLLIDEDELFRRALQGALRCLGFDVTAAEGAEIAVELVRASPLEFGAVITDRAMSRTTGIELVAELRIIAPHIRVAVHSTTPNVVARGVVRFIKKPAPLADLTDALRALLDASAAHARAR